MQASALEFLKRLVETAGPVGHEGPVQQVFRDYLKPHADEFVQLPHGSVAAIRNPAGNPRVIVTGHADEIGLTVHHITDKGFLFVRSLGGLDATILPGCVVDVHTAKAVLPGVIGRKPPHLLSAEERTKPVKLPEIYVDIGASSRREAERHVRPGDPMTFQRGFIRLGKDLVASKSMDNRTGVFCAAEALRRLGRARPRACVIALSTIGEEIGGDGALTAAFDLKPDVAIAIDVTFASDQPDVSVKETCEIAMGGGPAIGRGPRINASVVARLEKVARKSRIPIQYEVLQGRTGTDGDPIYRSRAGVPLGLIGIPCRYMHSPAEVVSLKDVDRISTLLAAFAKDLGPKTSFDPFPGS